jgi:hypothetical protein
MLRALPTSGRAGKHMKLLKRAGVFAGFLLIVTLAQAAPPPAEVFFKDADIVEAVLSPSGRRMALTSAKGTPRIGLVVMDMGPDGKMQRVAQFTDGDITQVHWVNEDRLIFSVTDLSDGSGRPNGAGPVRRQCRRQAVPPVGTAHGQALHHQWRHR